MTRRSAGWMLLLGAVVLASAAGESRGEEGGPEIVGVRVGFAGRYKVGLWTPVEVALRGIEPGKKGEVSLTMPDGDGVPSRATRRLGDDPTSVLAYARFGRVHSELTVQLHLDGEVVDQRVLTTSDVADRDHFLPAVPATRGMIVTIGSDALGVDEAVGSLRRESGEPPVVVPLEDLRQLPTRWYGYEGVDALVLSASRPEIFAELKPNDPRIAALDRWIELGGRLVLCVGSQAEAVLAEDGPLGGLFAPGKLQLKYDQPTRILDQTRELEIYAGISDRISQASGPLHVAWLANPPGVIEAHEADLPLVVRMPRVFGQIVLFAAEPDREPLSTWNGRSALMSKLLDFPTERAEESKRLAKVMQYGFNDVAGQLRSALDQFRNVKLTPFWLVWLVTGLVVVYILLIGPVDYFFLRKVVGRMRWTWLTFPVVVLAVSLAAYGLAYGLKGDQVRVNQADLVDVDVETGQVRGTSWLNVFSPRTERFDLSLRPNDLDGTPADNPHVLFGWLGLPGEALGGMNPPPAGAILGGEQLYDEPYEFSRELAELVGAPIQVWASKSFTARWDAQTDLRLEADLTEDDQELSGTIENTLDFPLAHCLLAFDRWVYDLGTLQPGETVRVGAALSRPELRTFLRIRRDGRKTPGEEETTGAYDLSSVDLPGILRTMSFFDAAEGRSYTGLQNGYQGFVDLSGLLKAGRAILVAEGPSQHRGADLLRDGEPMTPQEDRHVTIYRFVLPLKRPTPQQPLAASHEP